MKNRLRLIRMKKFFKKRIALLSVLVGVFISVINICFLFVVYGAISTMINISGEGKVETTQTMSNYYYKEGYFYLNENCTEKVTSSSNIDAEIVTFQDLINQAESDSVIYMLSTYTSPILEETVELGEKKITIKRYLNIDNSDLTFKSGSLINVTEIFTIDASNPAGSLIIDGQNIESTATGGAVNLYNSTFTINASGNVSFCNNIAYSGGVIGVEKNGMLEVSGVTFEDNLASVSSGTGAIGAASGNTVLASGGAIFIANNAKSVSISNSNFKNNIAQTGGAIYSNKTTNLQNCQFSENKANSESEARGGAVLNAAGTLTINSCEFFENEATGPSAKGGAICSDTQTLNIRNCNIHDNKSTSTGNFESYGGGVCSLSSKNTLLTIEGTLIENNKTYSSVDAFGGGVYSDGSITFSGNKGNTKIVVNNNEAVKSGVSLPNNFYLASDRTINLSGFKNAPGSQIGITTAAIPTIGYSVSICPSKAVSAQVEYFFSDISEYLVELINSALVLTKST